MQLSSADVYDAIKHHMLITSLTLAGISGYKDQDRRQQLFIIDFNNKQGQGQYLKGFR